MKRLTLCFALLASFGLDRSASAAPADEVAGPWMADFKLGPATSGGP